MPSPDQILLKASELIGLPYRHGGHSIYSVDCAGFVMLVLKELVLSSESLEEKHARSSGHGSGEMLDLVDLYLESCEEQPGSIGLFWTDPSTKAAQHMAILTDLGLIHADASCKKVVEISTRRFWQKRCLGTYLPKGVENWQR